MKTSKTIVKKHKDGCVGYPLGLKGVVVGEGDTLDKPLADVKAAIHFNQDAYGRGVLLGSAEAT